jgi:thioredoxin-related protein
MRWLLLAILLWALPSAAQEPPDWFVESFLDMREDTAEAAREGKRLMIYFMQDGCPYCRELVTVNFRDARIVAKMRRHFMSVRINIWGDREVTTVDGRKLPEKRFAAELKVQFTPTLVFFDEKGAVVHRINGYLPPEAFHAALERAIAATPAAGSGAKPARMDVRRKAGAKPVALVLTAAHCDACDELERILKRPELGAELRRFEVLRSATPAVVTTSTGTQRVESAYLPAIVFFVDGAEVFRTEAYLRPFHLSSALDYVASGSYRREPSFQRFVQARAEVRRRRGESVEIWD